MLSTFRAGGVRVPFNGNSRFYLATRVQCSALTLGNGLIVLFNYAILIADLSLHTARCLQPPRRLESPRGGAHRASRARRMRVAWRAPGPRLRCRSRARAAPRG